MMDSTQNIGTASPIPMDCLGRTCLKWSADGELTTLDLSLVMARLAQVDQELSINNETTGEPLASLSMG